MEVKDIIETFPKHKKALSDFFQCNAKIPDYQWKPKSDREFLLIVSELLNEIQQQRMYQQIASTFDPPHTVYNISSNVCPTIFNNILKTFG